MKSQKVSILEFTTFASTKCLYGRLDYSLQITRHVSLKQYGAVCCASQHCRKSTCGSRQSTKPASDFVYHPTLQEEDEVGGTLQEEDESSEHRRKKTNSSSKHEKQCSLHTGVETKWRGAMQTFRAAGCLLSELVTSRMASHAAASCSLVAPLEQGAVQSAHGFHMSFWRLISTAIPSQTPDGREEHDKSHHVCNSGLTWLGVVVDCLLHCRHSCRYNCRGNR